VLLVGVLAGVTVGGGVGVIAASSTKPVTVCANKKTNVLRYAKNGKCVKKTETKVLLNQTGATGATGATGTNGTVGAAGTNGTNGTNGATTNSQVKNLCGVNGTTACEVGLQGPGGGIVFMTPSTLGNTSGLFYEAAPSTWSSSSGDPTEVWCNSNNTLLGVRGKVPDSLSDFSGDLPTGAMDGANKTAVMLDWCTSGAAKLADAYTVAVNDVVYGDWFLPSLGELRQMYVNKTEIGGFVSGDYWSSTEYDATQAATIDAAAGDLDHEIKTPTMFKVRPVRSF
jgi:hypothetical protein